MRNLEGFNIGKKGSALERVKYDHNDISLLTYGDGIEVLSQTINKGRLFYVYPSDNHEILEFYFLVSGRIICDMNDGKVTLGPGDYFTIRGIEEPIHFEVVEDVTFLCVNTEQQFMHISKGISDLMDIVKQVERKDRYTFQHSDRVANYAVKIAKKLKLRKESLVNLTNASLLHDIGKIHTPEEVLNKPGRLTEEEFDLIKKHPGDGAKMIKESYYQELVPIIEQHHERLNGSGYPNGLKGDDIVLEARIIAVSDTFDAMTEDRSYRKAFTKEYALNEIKSMARSHYDPTVVEAFEVVLNEDKIL
ncbi:HD-GYP domain-containing protein [Thalassobacillus hwangdonensis]|uniref:HD-GYP domain-containing protein n=1 Tax=Thalassobacillus hwangdonensis TaxID=546108 RepID=A0ABW3L0X7_9BACI